MHTGGRKVKHLVEFHKRKEMAKQKRKGTEYHENKAAGAHSEKAQQFREKAKLRKMSKSVAGQQLAQQSALRAQHSSMPDFDKNRELVRRREEAMAMGFDENLDTNAFGLDKEDRKKIDRITGQMVEQKRGSLDYAEVLGGDNVEDLRWAIVTVGFAYMLVSTLMLTTVLHAALHPVVACKVSGGELYPRIIFLDRDTCSESGYREYYPITSGVANAIIIFAATLLSSVIVFSSYTVGLVATADSRSIPKVLIWTTGLDKYGHGIFYAVVMLLGGISLRFWLKYEPTYSMTVTSSSIIIFSVFHHFHGRLEGNAFPLASSRWD